MAQFPFFFLNVHHDLLATCTLATADVARPHAWIRGFIARSGSFIVTMAS